MSDLLHAVWQNSDDVENMLYRLEAALTVLGMGVENNAGDAETIAGTLLLLKEYVQDIRAKMDEAHAALAQARSKAA